MRTLRSSLFKGLAKMNKKSTLRTLYIDYSKICYTLLLLDRTWLLNAIVIHIYIILNKSIFIIEYFL